MSIDVVSEIVIDRPRAEVSSFAANPDNVPAWYVNIRSVEWKSEPPLRLGTKVAFVAQFMGMAIVVRGANRNDLARLKARLEWSSGA